MKAPEYPSDISQEWVEFVLNDYENRHQPLVTVTVEAYTVSNGLCAGDGFAGQIIKLNVEAMLSTNDKSEKKDYHLMVKLMSASTTDREENRRSSTDVREMLMYKEVIPELNKFAKSRGGNEFCLSMPGIIYGKCTDDEFVLVMEDLKQHGFDTLPNEKGLGYTQMKMAVEYLAKLHALSYSYDKIHHFLDQFPCYKNNYMDNLFFSSFKYEGLNNAKGVLKTMDGTDEITNKIELSEQRLMTDYDEAREQVSPKSIMCLTHADLWNKNIMFKLGKNNNVGEVTEGIHVLDWQRSFWNTSVFDLHFLIYTSTTQQLRKEHLEQLLLHYHSLFTSITTKMGTALEWSFKDFKAEYDRLQVFGVLRGLTITQFILSKQVKEHFIKSAAASMPYDFMRPVYHYLAKVLTSFKLSTPGQFIYSTFIRYMLGLVGKEMVDGTNPHMRERVLDIVYDADAHGLFDYKSNLA